METTKIKPGTKAQLPVSTSRKSFTVYGQKYEVLEYSFGEGPDLAQTIAIAESRNGREMLTLQDAKVISDSESKIGIAFKNAIRLYKWAYVRDQKSERNSGAAIITHTVRRRLEVYIGAPSFNAPVVILKYIVPDGTQQAKIPRR